VLLIEIRDINRKRKLRIIPSLSTVRIRELDVDKESNPFNHFINKIFTFSIVKDWLHHRFYELESHLD
jgi:hypothetical protein